jgi:hypothetical protein
MDYQPVHGGNPAKEAADSEPPETLPCKESLVGLRRAWMSLSSHYSLMKILSLCELFAFPIFITIMNYVHLSFLDIGKTSLVLLFTKDIHVIDRVASKLMDTCKKSQLGEPDISSHLVRRFCLFSNLLPELPVYLFSWVSMVGSGWAIQSLTWIQLLSS